MSGPAPAVAAVRLAVRAALADLAPGALVLVACSGGPDSLALAAATAFVAPRAGLRSGAVVVDHGLQPASAGVADDAGAACRLLGLDPVRVVRVAVGGVGGPEGAAREARYGALEQVAAELGASVVLLGHTLDDQAETVLLGLARGSGARSLAGMPVRRGVFRRPLLGVRRVDTLATCAALGLEPWHDPTNDGRPLTDGPAPRRSAVRRHVLPMLEDVLGPGVAMALARSAEQLREDADALDDLAAELIAVARAGGPALGVRHLAVAPLEAARPALRHRALRGAAIEAGCPPGALNRSHVLAIDALVTDWHGQGPVALPGRIGVLRACGSLTFLTPHD